MRSASGAPTPNTTWVRVSARGQRVQTSACSRSTGSDRTTSSPSVDTPEATEDRGPGAPTAVGSVSSDIFRFDLAMGVNPPATDADRAVMAGMQIDERMPTARGERRASRSSRSGRSRWLIVLIVVVVLAVGGAAAYLLTRDDDSSTSSPATSLSQGLALVVKGDTGGATQKFEDVLAAQPNNKLALYNLGLIDQQAGRTSQAEARYREVIAIDAAYAPALYNLGIIVAGRNDAPDAIVLYRRATEANPSFAAAFLNLGLLLDSTGDKFGGAVALQKAVQLDPTLASRIPAAERPAA